MKSLLASLFTLALMLVTALADAHQVGISRGVYTTEGNVVRVELTFARADAELLVPSADLVSMPRCHGIFDGIEPTEADGMRMRMQFRCPVEESVHAIDLAFFGELGQGHRHMASANGAQLVLMDKSAHLDLATSPAKAEGTSFAKLVGMGVEHILTGWDHLAFLFGLILLGGRLRSLALTISAFTVAHSITLGLAAFGVWSPPSSIVEPAIALSIAWVGVENVRAIFSKSEKEISERRWRITFPFGLVHGFGFASALSELGMSHAEVPKALFGFNLGVEMGQLAVVVPLAILLAWIGKRGFLPARAMQFASAGIVALGIVWFALLNWARVRTCGLSLLSWGWDFFVLRPVRRTTRARTTAAPTAADRSRTPRAVEHRRSAGPRASTRPRIQRTAAAAAKPARAPTNTVPGASAPTPARRRSSCAGSSASTRRWITITAACAEKRALPIKSARTAPASRIARSGSRHAAIRARISPPITISAGTATRRAA